MQSEINSSVMACGSLCSGLVVAIVISTSCLVRSSASCQLLLYWPEGKQGFGRRWRFVVITAAVHLIHLSIGPICHARWKLNFVYIKGLIQWLVADLQCGPWMIVWNLLYFLNCFTTSNELIFVDGLLHIVCCWLIVSYILCAIWNFLCLSSFLLSSLVFTFTFGCDLVFTWCTNLGTFLIFNLPCLPGNRPLNLQCRLAYPCSSMHCEVKY